MGVTSTWSLMLPSCHLTVRLPPVPANHGSILDRTSVRNYAAVIRPAPVPPRRSVSHPLRRVRSSGLAPPRSQCRPPSTRSTTPHRRRPVERDKALAMALSQIEKQHGKGSIMKMGEQGTMAIESISTGSIALDVALGVGGLPRGRVTEIYGPESSGKSTLAMHVVAEAQRNGGICAYIDAEHAMDPVYAANIGVDVDELLISQPDTGEQA